MEIFEVEFADCSAFGATTIKYEDGVPSFAQALGTLESCLAREPDPDGCAYEQIAERIHHHDVAMQFLLDVRVTEAFSEASAKRCAELDVRAYSSIKCQAAREHAAQIMKPMLVSRRYRQALLEASPSVLAAVIVVRPRF